MRVYYAHPLSLYNTEQEHRDLITLHLLFGEGNTVNPNNPFADAEYKIKYDMEVFFSRVRECDALAFRGLPGGKITAGVAAEIKVAQENNKLIIELPCFMDRALSVEDTRTYLKEVGFR